jgi:predicted exporter
VELTVTVAASLIGVAVSIAVALLTEHRREQPRDKQRARAQWAQPAFIVYFAWLCGLLVAMTLILLSLGGVEFELVAGLVGLVVGVGVGLFSYVNLRPNQPRGTRSGDETPPDSDRGKGGESGSS